MKTIFLDFEGTINNWDNDIGVDLNNVRILKAIMQKTNAKIVVTSSLKYSFQRKRILDYKKTTFYEYIAALERLGIKVDNVTPLVGDEGTRCLEILEYLRLNPEIEEFVILDDDYVGDQLKDYQVYLDNYLALQAEHIVPSLQI